jgi:hypothetical protein
MYWDTQLLPLLVIALPLVGGLKRDFLRQRRLGCADSDGIKGFNFSHAGLWIPGYSLEGKGFTKKTCAQACSKRDSCVAFSGAFTEYGWNGACYLYSATGADTPSANDRAYRRCAPEMEPSPVPTVKKGYNYGLKLLRAEADPQNAEDLVQMASTMQGELDAVSTQMVSANERMRRLKAMIAGESAMLVNSSRLAYQASMLTTSNRDGLRSIERARTYIDSGYAYLNTSEEKMVHVLERLEEVRAEHNKTATANSAAPVKPLSYYEPNVTKLEDVMDNLTKPETLKGIDELVTAYDTLESNISTVVQRVIHKNLRGLVNTQREALRNYTDVVAGTEGKDPCCCP